MIAAGVAPSASPIGDGDLIEILVVGPHARPITHQQLLIGLLIVPTETPGRSNEKVPEAICGLRPERADHGLREFAGPAAGLRHELAQLLEPCGMEIQSCRSVREEIASAMKAEFGFILNPEVVWPLLTIGRRCGVQSASLAGASTSRFPLLPIAETRPERSICSINRAARL